MENAKRDQNYVTTLMGVDMTTGLLPTKVYVDETTHRLLVSAIVTSGALGGTEYTEGNTDATFSGYVLMAEKPGNTASPLQMNAGGELIVAATASLAKDNLPIAGATQAVGVAIVDSSGNQISSFGGGTQYTDGDVDATPTGTVGMIMNGTTARAIGSSYPMPVSDNGGSLTVDGTVAVSGSVAVTGTFWQATQPISGTITANAGTNLNTSALALESTQTAMSAKLPATLGQKTMANSMAVALASDQSSIPVTGTFYQATQPVSIASTITVSATNLDVRDLVAASDAVTVHGNVGVLNQFDLTNSNPAVVAIVDGSGNQITSFGGGTQYADGAARGTATGTLMIGDDGTNVQSVKVDSSGVLAVQDNGGSITVDGTVAATQSGGWSVTNLANSGVDIGDVTINNAAGAGAVNIQDGGNSITVDGTFWQATQPVSIASAVPVTDNSGSLTVDAPVATPVFVRLSDGAAAITTLPVSLASVPSHAVTNAGTFAVQSTNQANSGVDIGDVTINNSTGAAAVNIQDGGNSITVDGTVAATQSGTWTVQPGNTANSTPWLTTNTPATTGGLTTYHLVSAATTNATVVKASAGQVFGWYIYNSNAAARKLVFHNSASAPTAGASVFFSIVIPPTAGANVFSDSGIAFSSGIAITTVTGLADSDSAAVAANDLIINLFYK